MEIVKPGWVNILSALLTPTIAITGTVIGVLQWKINQKRLQNELFERRIKLFEIITAHIANAITSGTLESADNVKFLRDTKHARFIFNKDIYSFVEEVYRKSNDLNFWSNRIKQLEGKPKEDAIVQNRVIFEWFQDELNHIQERFKEFLQL